MATITNEPILLDSTGRELLGEMKKHNGYLAMMAEGSRTHVYSSISQISHIVQSNSLEVIKKLFPKGDQIVVPWRDMDDSNHNTNDTAYQAPLDIVHHGMVELQSGEEVPGLFVQWHYTSPYGVQFDHQQAFGAYPNGLAADTYTVTIGANWGSNAKVNSPYHFTLTQPLPAGGRLSGMEGMPDQAPANWKVKSWASPTDANPIETVDMVAGSAGTNLGTLPFAKADDNGLNCMQKVAYGGNRWSTSAIRQYLNGTGANWWQSKTKYDIRPNEYAKKGFMTGFDEEFLAAIKPVKVTTALNTVEGYATATEDTYDAFFLPSLEQINAQPQLATAEGPYFEYWRERLGLNGFASHHPTTYTGYKIGAINAPTTPQNDRLRSAHRGNASYTWYVYSSGYVYYGSASNSSRFSPVCVIC